MLASVKGQKIVSRIRQVSKAFEESYLQNQTLFYTDVLLFYTNSNYTKITSARSLIIK